MGGFPEKCFRLLRVGVNSSEFPLLLSSSNITYVRVGGDQTWNIIVHQPSLPRHYFVVVRVRGEAKHIDCIYSHKCVFEFPVGVAISKMPMRILHAAEPWQEIRCHRNFNSSEKDRRAALVIKYARSNLVIDCDIVIHRGDTVIAS